MFRWSGMRSDASNGLVRPLVGSSTRGLAPSFRPGTLSSGLKREVKCPGVGLQSSNWPGCFLLLCRVGFLRRLFLLSRSFRRCFGRFGRNRIFLFSLGRFRLGRFRLGGRGLGGCCLCRFFRCGFSRRRFRLGCCCFRLRRLGLAAAAATRAAASACARARAASSCASNSASSAIRSCASLTATSRPLAMAVAISAVISLIARTPSSLPGIGYCTTEGSQFVSTIATTGMPSRLASATAIFSLITSTTKMAAGRRTISLMPPKNLFRRTTSCSIRRVSRFVVVGSSPLAMASSRKTSRSMRACMV